MATKARRHTHKYHKLNLSGSTVWACALPNCNHYMPAHLTPMVAGKASICWKCGADMILDDSNMKDDKPVCSECNTVQSSIMQKLTELGLTDN